MIKEILCEIQDDEYILTIFEDEDILRLEELIH